MNLFPYTVSLLLLAPSLLAQGDAGGRGRDLPAAGSSSEPGDQLPKPVEDDLADLPGYGHGSADQAGTVAQSGLPVRAKPADPGDVQHEDPDASKWSDEKATLAQQQQDQTTHDQARGRSIPVYPDGSSDDSWTSLDDQLAQQQQDQGAFDARIVPPVPSDSDEYGMSMQVDFADRLLIKLEDKDQDKFLGVMLASLEGTMIRFPGLPSLLKTDAVAAIVPSRDGSAFFDFGKVQLPMEIYIQGVGLGDGSLDAAAVRILPSMYTDPN